MYPIAPNMATPTARPAKVVSVKLRSLNRYSGITGSAARDSTTMNAAAPATAAAHSHRIWGEFQSYWLPPHVHTRMRLVVAAASRAMPVKSIRLSVSLGRLGRRRNAATAAMARMPSGILMENAQRHPGPSVSQPPSRGPATEDTANTAPMKPMYLPRSRAGTTSAMDACARIIRPPPPRPCTTRAAMSQLMEPAAAPITDPAMNSTIAESSTGLRPKRSEIRPYTGIMTVEARM